MARVVGLGLGRVGAGSGEERALGGWKWCEEETLQKGELVPPYVDNYIRCWWWIGRGGMGGAGAEAMAWEAFSYRILMTAFPFARPVSTYAIASFVDSKGKTRSTTGRMFPASISEVIWLNCAPLARMNRNE